MPAKISIFCKSNSILPKGVFWGAESESEVKIAKIQNVGSNMPANIPIFCKLNSILSIWDFWGAVCEREDEAAKFKMAA